MMKLLMLVLAILLATATAAIFIPLQDSNPRHVGPSLTPGPAQPPSTTIEQDLNALLEQMLRAHKSDPRKALDFTALDEFLTLNEKYNHLYGTFAIATRNQTYTRQIGYMDGDFAKKPNPHTRYRIGSISKTFTAILTMQAIERGLLTLDTPLSQFFPTAKWNIKYADKITIRHLLNHRSGLFNYTNDPAFELFKENHTLQDVIDAINRYSAQQQDPDTIQQGSYTNSGFYLLGHILAMVYKVDAFYDVLRKEIINPLHLTDTGFYSFPEEHHPAPWVEFNEVSTFALQNNGFFTKTEVYTDSSCAEAAGAVLTSVLDMVSFYKQVFVDHTIITKASIRQMQDYKMLVDGYNYGFGIWQIVDPFNPTNGNKHGFGHNGFIDGTNSHLSIYPADINNLNADPLNGDDYVIMAYSVNGMGTTPNAAQGAMLQTAFGHPVVVPNYDVDDNDENYPRYFGVYQVDGAPYLNLTIFQRPHTNEGPAPATPNKRYMLTFEQFDGTNRIEFGLGYYDQKDLYINVAFNVAFYFQPEQQQFVLYQGSQPTVCKKIADLPADKIQQSKVVGKKTVKTMH